MNLYFNNEEYFFVKNTKFNGVKYTLFIDYNTKSKILILDEDNNIIMDKYLTNSIMSQVFRKYSERYAEDDEDYEYFLEEYEEKPLSKERFNEICNKLKRLVFNQFGENVISEEEINRRINENLETIVIDPSIETAAQYDHRQKKILLLDPSFEENITIILYHEFLHALTSPGVQKVIAFGDEEEYEYGRGIDEGIIASLQKARRTKRFIPYEENISYPYESELVELLKIVYENTNEAKKDNLNFFDEYIKEPNKTLEKVNTIFQQDEGYLLKHSNLDDFKKETIGMSRALNFIVDMDDLYNAKDEKKEDIYIGIKKQLENLLIKQISNDFPTNERELYDVLFSLEGFQLKSRDKSEEIEKFKKEVIKDFLKRNDSMEIEDLENWMPPFDRQSDLSENERKTATMFTILTRDYSKADIRCQNILNTFKEVKNELTNKKKKID